MPLSLGNAMLLASSARGWLWKLGGPPSFCLSPGWGMDSGDGEAAELCIQSNRRI